MAELRPPTLEERKAGLPKTKQEAIDAGLTRFIPEDGKERVIRGYGSKLTPGGHVKMASSRKATSGNRRIAEDMATPDETTKRAADKAMADMRSRGNVGHHRFPVSYLAAGEREQPGTIEAYKRVHGEENIGHTPKSIDEMSIPDHNRLHNVEEPAMWRSIKKSGSQADEVFGAFRALARNKTFGALLPGVGIGFGALDIAERSAKAAETKDPADALQATLAGAGMTPVVGVFADLSNIIIDAYRWKGSHQRIRGRSGAKRAQEALQ